jgi:hypothetical protein
MTDLFFTTIFRFLSAVDLSYFRPAILVFYKFKHRGSIFLFILRTTSFLHYTPILILLIYISIRQFTHLLFIETRSFLSNTK